MILILKEVSSQMDRAFPASLRRSVVIFSIIILGCGLESYINPVIFKNCFKKFFSDKNKILGRYYVNKPYIVFCYKNENLRNFS